MLDFCGENGTFWNCFDAFQKLGTTNQLLIGLGIFVALFITLRIIDMILKMFEE